MANRYFVEALDADHWTEVPFAPLDRKYDAQMLAIAVAFTENKNTRVLSPGLAEYFRPSEGQFLSWCASDVQSGLQNRRFGLPSR